jgi:hypothetical protein
MSKSHEFAWAAGFFDGEGWVKIQKRGSKKYLGYYLRIGINHVDPAPLYKLQKLFGGSVRHDKKVNGNRKPRYVWTLSTKNAKEFLSALMPYLVNKREVASLGLEFQDTIGATGQKVSEDTQLFRALLADRIKYLNSLD